MHRRLGFGQNFVYFLLPTVLQAGVAFVVIPLLTLRLSPEDFGIYNLLNAFIGIGYTVSGLGTGYLTSAHYQNLDTLNRQKLISTIVLTGQSALLVFSLIVLQSVASSF